MDLNENTNEALIKGLEEQKQLMESEKRGIEVGAEPAGSDTKKSSFSKNLINVIIILVFIIGCSGAFFDKMGFFSMDAYIRFIESFAFIFVPLIFAVGGGRAFKNYTEKKFK